MKLKSKNFILRHIKMSDLEEYYKAHKDKAMIKNFMTVPKNINEAKKEIKEKISDYKKKKPKGEAFIIEINKKLAGEIGIHNISYGYEKHKAKISYWLKKEFRGKNLMVEPVKLITKYAFKKYKLKRIVGICRTFNKRSANVLKKAGYKLEGILRKNKCKNGKYMDDMVWARVK